jgi:hypothetical protein
MRKYIEDCIDTLLDNNSLQKCYTDTKEVLHSFVTFQFFYNERTNKSFIQFDVSDKQHVIDPEKLTKLITWRIDNQFRLDTGIWPEIVNTSAQRYNPDNTSAVTPYTIGYWLGINGQWEAIEDRAEIELDMMDIKLPPTHKKNIITLYTKAEEISRRYKLLTDLLPENTKNEYIERAREILTQYHDPMYKDIYKEKMDELNAEYETEYENGNLPEAVSEYMNWYREFFKANIPEVHRFTRRFILKVG